MGGGVNILRLLRRADFWIAALGILALTGAILLSARIDTGQKEGADANPAQTPYSTYNTGERGLKAIYNLMEARGTNVSRWRRPAASLGPDVHRLVVWQPAALSAEDLTGLERWVRDGGTLILSLPPKQTLRSLLPAGELVTVEPEAPVTGLAPAGISPVVRGVSRLEGREGYYWNKVPDRSGVAVYVANRLGMPVVAGWPLEKGQVYTVAEPALLTNSHLPRSDNLTLAVNLLEPAPGRTLAFDEYHHGAEVGEDWWQTLRPQLRWSMLQAALAALLVLILAGARLGQPVEAPEGVSRNSVEFAHGLGNLLRESRANRWVLERLYRSFRRDLARHLGTAPAAGHEELGRLWQRHTGEEPGPLIQLLDQSAADGEPADRNLLAALSRMAEFRRRMGAGRSD